MAVATSIYALEHPKLLSETMTSPITTNLIPSTMSTATKFTPSCIKSVNAYFLLPPTGPTIWIDGPIYTPRVAQTPIVIRYMAEGAANVLWTINIDPIIQMDPTHRRFLEGRLLRLRKGSRSYIGKGVGKNKKSSREIRREGPSEDPGYMSTANVAEFHESLGRNHTVGIDCLVGQETVNISKRVLNECNKVLNRLEKSGCRPKIRHQWALRRGESKGLLITSMLPDPEHTALVELKPKWLRQSPGAPPNSRRCRTCATHARRGTSTEKLPVCSLALLSENPSTVRNAVFKLPKSAIHPLPAHLLIEEVTEHLIQFFVKNLPATQNSWDSTNGRSILEGLGEAQAKFDPLGVIRLINLYRAYEEEFQDLGKAMTLRDCTLFIQLRKDMRTGEWHVEGKLADLDPKAYHDKERREKWVSDERKLVAEGWYTGTEKLKEGTQHHTSCILWDV
jgi:inositol-pentakisphosphate 2-kinase